MPETPITSWRWGKTLGRIGAQGKRSDAPRTGWRLEMANKDQSKRDAKTNKPKKSIKEKKEAKKAKKEKAQQG
jgi:hypothetical protein